MSRDSFSDEKNHAALLRQMENRAGEISQLKAENRRLTRQIQRLEEAAARLSQIEASRSYRLAQKLSMAAPSGSRRWALLLVLLRLVRHPGRTFSQLFSGKAGPLFRAVLKGDKLAIEYEMSKLQGTLVPELPPVHEMTPRLNLLPINEASTPAFPPEGPLLSLPRWDFPKVSIVIPVYNQWNYTEACLKAILENTQGAPYEVILADDNSTDFTRFAGIAVENLVVSRNPENLGFLRNCNKAAGLARGEYIFFLNNDTQPCENWMMPLVSLLDGREDVGITGSMLLYPDGRLQEAGCIVWQDGSAWNYGRGDDPARPEYNYLRETDYISGAALMVRKSLFEQLGGFDTRYTPAYYEDNDLAFEARRAGYKVVYQPLSRVVHFEGVSNGVSTQSGIKQYQVENGQKFLEKWREVLSGHYPNGTNILKAKDRAFGREVVLVVDHYVPEYDKDAGSRNTMFYLKTMVEMGYLVKFIGDNLASKQPYTQMLTQMGIEVLYGQWHGECAKGWIREHGGALEYAYLNRPHISIKYIPLIRSNSGARIVYHGHDLHHQRLLAQYEVEKDPELKGAAERWLALETTLFRQADAAVTVSSQEKQAIARLAPGLPVTVFPIFCYDDFPRPAKSRIAQSEGILFVGGFRHSPNVDGLLWMVQQIMPLLPGHIRLHVVGSHPPREVLDLESERVRILGFVTDEELNRLYTASRVVAVALRYGAGVKGKTIEAMHSGTPVVSTSFGIEGLPGIEAVLSPKDDAQSFAAEILRLYNDEDARYRAGTANAEYIEAHFSNRHARDCVREMFEGGRPV